MERHIGGDSWVSSSRTSDNEEEEGLGMDEVQNQAPTVPQTVSTSILLHNISTDTHSPSLCNTQHQSDTHTDWIVTTLPGPGGGGEAGSAGGPAAAGPDQAGEALGPGAEAGASREGLGREDHYRQAPVGEPGEQSATAGDQTDPLHSHGPGRLCVCVSLSTAKGLLDTVCLHVCPPWPR